jgi:hypothetical protein
MGITVSSVYNDVLQEISKENGVLTITDFNRLSKRAENFIIDYITGRIQGDTLPQMYFTQKVKDYVSVLIKEFTAGLDSEGRITKPTDYYMYENMYSMSLEEGESCDEEELDCDKNDIDNTGGIKKVQVQLLDGDKFTKRLSSKIKGLSPSVNKPIAKEVGNYFYFAPKELAGITLEYVKYPTYAVAVGVIDTIYFNEVISNTLSTNYEWPEYARNLLAYVIVDLYSNSVRENALKQFNNSTNKQLTP